MRRPSTITVSVLLLVLAGTLVTAVVRAFVERRKREVEPWVIRASDPDVCDGVLGEDSLFVFRRTAGIVDVWSLDSRSFERSITYGPGREIRARDSHGLLLQTGRHVDFLSLRSGELRPLIENADSSMLAVSTTAGIAAVATSRVEAGTHLRGAEIYSLRDGSLLAAMLAEGPDMGQQGVQLSPDGTLVWNIWQTASEWGALVWSVPERQLLWRVPRRVLGANSRDELLWLEKPGQSDSHVVWSSPKGTRLREREAHGAVLWEVEGDLLFVVDPPRESTLCILDAFTGNSLRTVPFDGVFCGVAASPDGTQAAVFDWEHLERKHEPSPISVWSITRQ